MPDRIPIFTERLMLRSVRADDAVAIFNYHSDADANRYQGWIPASVEEAIDFIHKGISPKIDISGTWYQLAIILKDTGRLIGDIGLHFVDPGGYQVEIGYTLDKEEQGRGYALEALTAVVNFLFVELKKRRIVASIDPRNIKSIALVERLGFRKEAHFRESLLLRGEWVDDVIYAMLRSDWVARGVKRKRVTSDE